MKLSIVRACLVGGQHQELGKVLEVGVDIDADTAQKLISIRRAVPLEQEAAADTSSESKPIDVDVTTLTSETAAAIVAEKKKGGKKAKA